ncbi:MAG TPA: protein-glutamate O-methyltransferase CheR [Anaerolineales bacterium]|nr:protein-glutamate O-methyltransferase CheR [Anaerolineales bacterium]
MKNDEIERIEVELLVDALHRRYGYDFRHYARASLRRRLRHALAKSGYKRLSELLDALLWDENVAHTLIANLSVTVTEMFRDPSFYQAVRKKILPYLGTYPFFKVWVAGCATGEEVYSLAILLYEEGLYERAKLFATDFNETALKQAKDGIYPLKDMRQHTSSYQKAGGQGSFSDYYHADYQSAIINPALKTNITFANHNLATDGIFSDVQLIFCRNVLIYFDRVLQNWVLNNFTQSLGNGGFLCLGNKESLDALERRGEYAAIDAVERIYQKRPATGPLQTSTPGPKSAGWPA